MKLNLSMEKTGKNLHCFFFFAEGVAETDLQSCSAAFSACGLVVSGRCWWKQRQSTTSFSWRDNELKWFTRTQWWWSCDCPAPPERLNSMHAENNQVECNSGWVCLLQEVLTLSRGDPDHHYHCLISIKTEVPLEPWTQFTGRGRQ